MHLIKIHSISSWIRRIWVKHAIFCVVIILGFSIRLVRFHENYQVDNFDFVGDYLIADHIITYQEYPEFGQGTSVFNQLPNSPLYYYFLTGPLFLKNDIYTLAYFNIALQLISLIMLYALAWTLFNPSVALFTGIILALNQQFINQTFLLWQPTVSAPFFHASYFFLAYGYVKKNIYVIILGALSYSITFGFGYYGIAGLPFIVVIVLLSLRRARASLFGYLGGFASIIGLPIVVSAPVIRYLFHTKQLLFFLDRRPYVSGSEYIDKIFITLSRLLEGFVPPDRLTHVNVPLLFFFVLLIFLYYAISTERSQRNHSIVLNLFVLETISIASFLRNDPPWHLISIVGPFIILLVEMLHLMFQKGRIIRLFCVLGATYLILLGEISPSYIQQLLNRNIRRNQEDAARAMIPALTEIQMRFGSNWPTFFKIITYDDLETSNGASGLFWPFLEKLTNTKLTGYQLFGTYGQNFAPLGIYDNYLIVICSNYDTVENAQNHCLRRFQSQFPQHTVRIVYDGGVNKLYIIYLAALLTTP